MEEGFIVFCVAVFVFLPVYMLMAVLVVIALLIVIVSMSSPKRPGAPESPKYVEVPRETEKDDPVAEDAPDASSCISCTESVSVCVVLPCMHKCVCCKCARELGKDGTAEQKSVKCPICRGEIEAIKRVY